VHNVATRQPCGTVSERLSSHNETVLHGRLVARRDDRAGLSLLKAIEWLASVMHSIECLASIIIIIIIIIITAD